MIYFHTFGQDFRARPHEDRKPEHSQINKCLTRQMTAEERERLDKITRSLKPRQLTADDKKRGSRAGKPSRKARH